MPSPAGLRRYSGSAALRPRGGGDRQPPVPHLPGLAAAGRPPDRIPVAVPRHTPGPIDLRPMPEAGIIALVRRLRDEPAGNSVPAALFSAPRTQIALFMRHLWSSAGCISWDVNGESCIYYVSQNRRLIDDLARLLLRFNVMTRIAQVRGGRTRPCYRLIVDSPEDQMRFLDGLEVPGAGERIAELARQKLTDVRDASRRGGRLRGCLGAPAWRHGTRAFPAP